MNPGRIRPTWVEVDLDAIAANVQTLKACAPNSMLMAVVKANAYGHGVVQVAKAAVQAGAEWLGVASVEEGMELRRAGITTPCLILGHVQPGQADNTLLYDLRPTVYQMEVVQECSKWARAYRRKMALHVKVDTGMGRVGLPPEQVVAFIKQVNSLPMLEVEGLFTHFAVADEPENPMTGAQISRYNQVLADLEAEGIQIPIRHTCNSAGIMIHPSGHYDMVRAGIAMYGMPPDPQVKWPVELKPALTWKTRISFLKEVEAGAPLSYGGTYRPTERERIAVLPVGYADGLSRNLSNRGVLLVNDHPCPIVGRVCMDQTLIRIPDGVEAQVGDDVIIIGPGQPAHALAQMLGTINYEIVCDIGPRVPRFYRRGDEWIKEERRPG
ncbi:MAG TPA: alanine racemase [Symbiobacteriaceae bacterium]|nr:alanine racemase [Symbiobacteriaceae bacterium]